MKRLVASFMVAMAVGAATPAVTAVLKQAVHAVVYIDLVPSEQATGSAILAGYARRARQDPELSSVMLIELSSIPNHFILHEAFVSEAAYQRFTRQAYVRDFRAALYPHLGSPWDERLGSVFAPSQVQP